MKVAGSIYVDIRGAFYEDEVVPDNLYGCSILETTIEDCLKDHFSEQEKLFDLDPDIVADQVIERLVTKKLIDQPTN